MVVRGAIGRSAAGLQLEALGFSFGDQGLSLLSAEGS